MSTNNRLVSHSLSGEKHIIVHAEQLIFLCTQGKEVRSAAHGITVLCVLTVSPSASTSLPIPHYDAQER